MASDVSDIVAQIAVAALDEILPATAPILEIGKDIGELVQTIITSKSPADAVKRAAQNALADTEDATAEETADAILKGSRK